MLAEAGLGNPGCALLHSVNSCAVPYWFYATFHYSLEMRPNQLGNDPRLLKGAYGLYELLNGNVAPPEGATDPCLVLLMLMVALNTIVNRT